MIWTLINNQAYKIVFITLLLFSIFLFLLYHSIKYLKKKNKLNIITVSFFKLINLFVFNKGIFIPLKVFLNLCVYSFTLMFCFFIYTSMVFEIQLSIIILSLFIDNTYLAYYFSFIIVISVNWITSFWPFCKLLAILYNWIISKILKSDFKMNEIINLINDKLYDRIKAFFYLAAVFIVIFKDVKGIKDIVLKDLNYPLSSALYSSILVAIIIDRFSQLRKTNKNRKKTIEENDKIEKTISSLNNYYQKTIKNKDLSESDKKDIRNYTIQLKLSVYNKYCYTYEDVVFFINKLKKYENDIELHINFTNIEKYFKQKYEQNK